MPVRRAGACPRRKFRARQRSTKAAAAGAQKVAVGADLASLPDSAMARRFRRPGAARQTVTRKGDDHDRTCRRSRRWPGGIDSPAIGRGTVTRSAKTAVLSVLGTLAVLALGGFVLLYSGLYNVAATRAHFAPVAWATTTLMEHSVRDHASEVTPPPPADSAQVTTGFGHFESMCVTCHGAPGQDRSEIGRGLLPEPPELSEAAGEWSRAELFWIVKHGIKMTGMPAFGPTHDDETIWAIVAWVERLPEMSPAEYEAYRAAAGTSGGGHGHGGGSPASGDAHGHGGGDGATEGAGGGHQHD
jgi:mono/diheme cytochrome c family protein